MSFSRRSVALLAAAMTLFAAEAAQAATSLIASDPFTNPESNHRTLVEPDSFAAGSTIVTAAQSGRYFDGGASGIQFATSKDGGATWTQGTLPGITTHGNGGVWDRVTDPAVAYHAASGRWLISTLGLMPGATSPAVLTSISADGGLSFGPPVVTAPFVSGTSYDKNWIVCDNNLGTSPHYGKCYTTWDDNAKLNRLLASVSSDGGATWGPPVATPNLATGIGGQPLVQPDGTVIVPSANANETQMISIRSTTGGASWSNPVLIANVADHAVAGSLRSGPLPSAEIDASGKVYVVWQDCRFRKGCKSNDIVMSTTTNGTTWTAPARIPIDSTTGAADYFIPGLGVDASTSGATARLGLTYHSYANARCGTKCVLQAGYVQSNNGGVQWGTAVPVGPPFAVSLAPNTSQGRMVGDYISTSWSGGKAFAPIAIGRTPVSPFAFSLGLEVTLGGLTASGGGFSSANDRPVANAAADHAAPQSAIRKR
jgi:hypothetical protein